jgi:hypothetical protein
MADVLELVRTTIEERLGEVEAEAQRLRAALAGLGQGRPSGSPKRQARRRAGQARRSPGRRPGGKRAPRGQREAEFLAAIKKKPGAKPPEIAEEMGVAPNQVYGLARRLHAAGKVRKRRGGGYAVKT